MKLKMHHKFGINQFQANSISLLLNLTYFKFHFDRMNFVLSLDCNLLQMSEDRESKVLTDKILNSLIYTKNIPYYVSSSNPISKTRLEWQKS